MKMLHEKLNEVDWDMSRVADILDTDTVDYLEPYWIMT